MALTYNPTTQEYLSPGEKPADRVQGIPVNQTGGVLPPTPITYQDLTEDVKPLAFPLAPSSTAVSNALGQFEAQVAQSRQAEAERVKQLKSEEDKSKSELTGLINEYLGRGEEQTRLETEAEIGTKTQKVTDYTNKLEQEQQALRRQIEAIRKNPSGLLAGAVEQEVRRAERESYSKQADISLLQSAANRDLATAQGIIDRKIALKYEPMREHIDFLQGLYQINRDDLSKAEQNQLQAKTRDEQRQYDRLITQEKSAYDLWVKAAGNGAPVPIISQANSLIGQGKYDEVNTLLAPYAQTIQTDTVKLDNGNTLLIDKRTGAIIKNYGGGVSPGVTPGGLTINGQKVDTDPYVNAFNSASLGLTADQRKTAAANFQKLVGAGDVQGAKDYIVRTAIVGAPVDQQNQAIGRRVAVDQLTHIQQLLNEAKKNKSSTGLVTGSLQNVTQKLGQSGDENLAKIGVEIANALQTYRRSMTGVAFNDAESKEYKKIFPDITNVDQLNAAKIEALTDVFRTNDKSVLSFYVGSTNYDKIFGPEATIGNLNNPNNSLPATGNPFQTVVDSLYNPTTGMFNIPS